MIFSLPTYMIFSIRNARIQLSFDLCSLNHNLIWYMYDKFDMYCMYVYM